MPRKARQKNESQIYHVTLRGINRQQIFYDEDDYACFIDLLKRYKTVCGYQLHAYCLMGNHIHLLIQENDEPLEKIFRRLGAAFVYWYNAKYGRVGHLFQDRFKSEAVNDDAYFLTVLRYILRNPVKAGLCTQVEEYPYSSARAYLCGADDDITDQELSLSLAAKSELSTFIKEEENDNCLDMEETVRIHLTDTVACELIVREFGVLTPDPGKAKERAALNASIRRLLAAGVSVRQLSRLSGLSKKIIESSK